jgi:hypothetical protein
MRGGINERIHIQHGKGAQPCGLRPSQERLQNGKTGENPVCGPRGCGIVPWWSEDRGGHQEISVHTEKVFDFGAPERKVPAEEVSEFEQFQPAAMNQPVI